MPYRQLDDPDGRHVVWTIETFGDGDGDGEEDDPEQVSGDVEIMIETKRKKSFVDKTVLHAVIELLWACIIVLMAVVALVLLGFLAFWTVAQVFYLLFIR